MKRLLLLSLTFFYINASWSQTWSDDVAQIVYNKCSQCHHTGGIGPFPLVTYNETSPLSSLIESVVNSETMPPWPPDNNYQQYAHDRSLSATEKATLLAWIANGSQEGTPGNTPPPPVFNTGSVLGGGDLEVQIPTYMSKATAFSDDYVCFAIPSGLASDRVVKAIEVVPGNREIVHHCLVYVDPNSGSVTDTVGGDCGGPSSSTASLAMGYTPGSSPMVLPSTAPLKLGMTMPAGSQVYLAMHYPAGSFGLYDSTRVIFHFYPQGESGVREVSTAPILQNWSFSLPPDQVSTVSAQYPATGGLPANISVLSTFPHMHLLGQEIKAYAVTPTSDTVKYISIPEWDFEWQDFYFFKNIQKTPLGSVIKGEGIYDNTSGNPNNPNSPPQTVTAGLNTTDEMFLIYFHYMLYLPGDENYDMDSLLNVSLSTFELENPVNNLVVYPNPFADELYVDVTGLNGGEVVLASVYDLQGKLVKKLSSTGSGTEKLFVWDGSADNGTHTHAGVYVISVNVDGKMSYKRVIRN